MLFSALDAFSFLPAAIVLLLPRCVFFEMRLSRKLKKEKSGLRVRIRATMPLQFLNANDAITVIL